MRWWWLAWSWPRSLEFKPTSVEQTLGSLGSTEGFQDSAYLIESTVLFAIQLVRVVLSSLVMQTVFTVFTGPMVGVTFVNGIHEMLNAIIISVYFYFFCFTDDINLALGHRTNNYLVRTSMRLFDDEESFKEIVGSLSFNNPQVIRIPRHNHFGKWVTVA